jgi:fluoroacetyl-CoA thioesterase
MLRGAVVRAMAGWRRSYGPARTGSVPRVKDSLVPGIEHTLEATVTADMSPPHLPVVVLSTPSMIQLMEQTCLLSAVPHLDAAEATVGTHVCVSHVAAAREGEVVTVTGQLVDVQKRRLRYEVRAAVGDRLLGEGTHDRAVIDTSRFGG